MPRPPRARSSVRSACTYMSKMNGSSLGEMPKPVSSTREHGVVAVGAERHANPAAGWRVLDRVGHDVGQHLLEPHGVAIDPHGLGADVDVPIQPGVAGEGGDRPAHRLGHVERLPIQPDLSGDHALDVEQIVDQMRDVADLPRDHFVRAGRGLPLGVRRPRAPGRRC